MAAQTSPVLDHVAVHMDSYLTQEPTRVSVICYGHGNHVHSYLLSRINPKFHRNDVVWKHDGRNAQFRNLMPSASALRSMLAIVDVKDATDNEMAMVSHSNVVYLICPRWDRSVLRRVKDSLFSASTDSLVEIFCVAASPQRQTPSPVLTFLRSLI